MAQKKKVFGLKMFETKPRKTMKKRPISKKKPVKTARKKRVKKIKKRSIKKKRVKKVKKKVRKPVKKKRPVKRKIVKKRPVKRKITKKKPKKVIKKTIRPKKVAKKKIFKIKRIKRIGERKSEWIKTGITGFDKLFAKGIPRGHSVLIEGGPGVGKTIMSLQIAYNACKQGKKVLYMSFEEPEKNLLSHMKNFGWNPEEFIRKDLLRIKRFNALDVARSVEALLSEAKKELLIEIQPVFFPSDFKPDIICVDSLTSIASAFTGEEARFRIYMEQLFRYLEKTDITSFLIREVGHPTHIGGAGYTEKGEAISFLSDGIIVLYNVIYDNGRRGFGIEVLKMRGEKIDRRIVKSEITKHGLKVYPNKSLTDKQHIKHSLA